MNIGQMHDWLERLLAAGVSRELPLGCLSNGWPCEVANAVILSGPYKADPSPYLTGPRRADGTMLTLIPVGQDSSELSHEYAHGVVSTHQATELPVDFPWNEQQDDPRPQLSPVKPR